MIRMNTYAIILAAGASSRLAKQGVNTPKQFFSYEEKPLFWHSAKVFSRVSLIKGLVFVFPDDQNHEEYYSIITSLEKEQELGIPWSIVVGGKRRQDSVWNALQALPSACNAVLIHDGARPFVTAELAYKAASLISPETPAVIPGIFVTDTIKIVDEKSLTLSTPQRSCLRAVQTPQAFLLKPLFQAHQKAQADNFECTDDAQLLERTGTPVLVIEGEVSNKKITYEEDLNLLLKECKMRTPCTGFGYDVHRYGGKRAFILGGVPIKTDITIDAHSDGDTLLHALMDAMLALIGAGDIGGLFPDSDPAFEGISSGVLLSQVYDQVQKFGVVITHVSLTIVAQVPRITPHRQTIAKNIANLLGLSVTQVNVGASTEERLGFIGEKKGIKAIAVVTGFKEEV